MQSCEVLWLQWSQNFSAKNDLTNWSSSFLFPAELFISLPLFHFLCPILQTCVETNKDQAGFLGIKLSEVDINFKYQRKWEHYRLLSQL